MSGELKPSDSSALASTSLVDDILNETKLLPTEDGYDVARRGISALVSEMLAGDGVPERVDRAYVDSLIATLDEKLSKQLDDIVHAPAFQKLEASWRGMKFVVDRTDFRENIKIELLNASKEDLLQDFEDASDITKSGLYKLAYTAEYGQFGGKPYGAIVSNYDVGYGPQDIALLQKAASVGAMAHAPFFAAAGPQFFGQKNFLALPNLKDIKSLLESPQYAKWQSFRDTEDARYVGLLMPRFMLRLPYGPSTTPTKTFNYTESAVGQHDAYLWGNATFAFATRLTESFAKYRWCPNIIGPQAGGTVDNLPLHQYEAMGERQTKTPTEILISERREYELAEEGLIPLVFRKDGDSAAFFSANGAQRPKRFGQSPEGKAAEMNYRLGTQLPYLFIVNRIAHYIKVIQREQIGATKERADLEFELNTWLRQYVADMDNVTSAIRGKRPLREAQITVADVEGNPGWYKVDMRIRPHFKYMGAFFTLSLVGKLDKD